MEIAIKNPTDLHNEIIRLQILEQEQSALLKLRFKSPAAIFSTALTAFPKSSTVDGMRNSGLFHQDFLGLASRFVLPFLLNKTIFKKSNFLIKALIGILSQKASGYISEDKVSSLWKRVRSMLGKKSDMERVRY